MRIAFSLASDGAHVAEDRHHHYYVWGAGKTWHVNVKLRFHDNGVAADLATQPVLAHGTADSCERAQWIASEFSGLGRDYEPRAHAGRTRMGEAERRVRKGEHQLKFRKVERGHYHARSTEMDYHVQQHRDGFWQLRINRLTTTAGVTHSLGDTYVADGHHQTKTTCVLVARHFHWLGPGYQPHEHGHKGRYTAASLRAYAQERARWEADNPAPLDRLRKTIKESGV